MYDIRCMYDLWFSFRGRYAFCICSFLILYLTWPMVHIFQCLFFLATSISIALKFSSIPRFSSLYTIFWLNWCCIQQNWGASVTWTYSCIFIAIPTAKSQTPRHHIPHSSKRLSYSPAMTSAEITFAGKAFTRLVSFSVASSAHRVDFLLCIWFRLIFKKKYTFPIKYANKNTRYFGFFKTFCKPDLAFWSARVTVKGKKWAQFKVLQKGLSGEW